MAKKELKDQNGFLESLNSYDQFLSQTRIDRLQKILARYELYKMVLDVPGDIVECGVYKGSGVYTFAKLQRIFRPNNEQRIIGFDFFEMNREMNLGKKEDQQVLDEHAQNWVSRETILRNLEKMDIGNVELIPGNVVDTTRIYAKENLGFRISLLYLDVDNYEGTLAILKNLYPLVALGGVVAFDEYAYRGYGESDAVDEFFKGIPLKINAFVWANTPTGYFVKERT